MKNTIAAILLGVSSLSFAYEITDFTVFSKGDITYARSDFEGLTGAGGSVRVEDFSFVRGTKNGILVGENYKQTRGHSDDIQLFVGGLVQLQNALFRGDMQAFSVTLDFTSVEGEITTSDVFSTEGKPGYPSSSYFKLKKISRDYAEELSDNLRLDLTSLGVSLDTFSKECKGLVSTQVPALKRKIVFEGSKKLNVFAVTASDLKLANEVVFNMPFASSAVINVSGDNVEMQNKGVKLNGADPKKIIWNMYEAKTMLIARSGSAEVMSGRSVGLPGTFVAPYADTLFQEAVITGSLWVNSLKGGSAGKNGGQVNDGLYAGHPCRRIVIGGKQ